jgi:hypothetical protein
VIGVRIYMGTKSEGHAEKAETALERALENVTDALKHVRRRDKGSYEQSLDYVVRYAMRHLGEAEQELRQARDTAPVQEEE